MLHLDRAELPALFEDYCLLSERRPALARFRREDYLGPVDIPLDTAVRDLVERESGQRPSGSIRLMTHLRYFNYCFNPVSFYFINDDLACRVKTIVAEFSNTPWLERHPYVLTAAEGLSRGTRKHFRFGKQFHVSPFNSMNQVYDWRFTEPAKTFTVHMQNIEAGAKVFDAVMSLRRREITSASMLSTLIRFPLVTAKVTGVIYWQALRLRLKSAPVYTHPGETVRRSTGSPEALDS